MIPREIDRLLFKFQAKLYKLVNKFRVFLFDLLMDNRKEYKEGSYATPDNLENEFKSEVFKAMMEMRQEMVVLRKEMHENLTELKAYIGKLTENITKVESEILIRCLNQILEQMSKGKLSRYLCLTPQEDANIVWQKLTPLAEKWE